MSGMKQYFIAKAWQEHDQRMHEAPDKRAKCPCSNCKRVVEEQHQIDRAKAMNRGTRK